MITESEICAERFANCQPIPTIAAQLFDLAESLKHERKPDPDKWSDDDLSEYEVKLRDDVFTFISENPGATQADIIRGAKRKTEAVRRALSDLLIENKVAQAVMGNNVRYKYFVTGKVPRWAKSLTLKTTIERHSAKIVEHMMDRTKPISAKRLRSELGGGKEQIASALSDLLKKKIIDFVELKNAGVKYRAYYLVDVRS